MRSQTAKAAVVVSAQLNSVEGRRRCRYMEHRTASQDLHKTIYGLPKSKIIESSRRELADLHERQNGSSSEV